VTKWFVFGFFSSEIWFVFLPFGLFFWRFWFVGLKIIWQPCCEQICGVPVQLWFGVVVSIKVLHQIAVG
jgi:hypothetical protein